MAQLFPEDMLRFAQQYPFGTARAMSMGGAFGSLGGDLTSLSINPAGIGVFHSSEFTLTPYLSFNNAITKFGQSASDYFNDANLSNIGFVSVYNNHQEKGWMGINFGIAYNQLNDFGRTVTMERSDAPSSLLDQFTYNANVADKGALNPLYEGLALQTGALYQTSNDSVFSYYSKSQHGEYQQETRNISGGIGEWAISLGSNYNNRFYIGLTIGIQQVNYQENSPFYEQAPGSVPSLSSFTFSQHLTIEGSGINFKLGAIYKPFNWIRLGVAVHTPTSYSLQSNYYTSMRVFYNNNTYYPWTSSGNLSFDNSLVTPWRGVFSAALLFKQYGLISVDDEILNYRNMQLSGDLVTNQNASLSSMYKTVNNCRVGAEGKIGSFALRVGYGYYGSPFASGQLNQNTTYQTYSAGFGFRSEHSYIDFAYILIKYPEHYTLYDENEVNNNGLISWSNNPLSNTAKTVYNLNQFVMTFGFKF